MDFNKILTIIIIVTLASTGILSVLLIVTIDRLGKIIDDLKKIRIDLAIIHCDVEDIERRCDSYACIKDCCCRGKWA